MEPEYDFFHHRKDQLDKRGAPMLKGFLSVASYMTVWMGVGMAFYASTHLN